MPKYLNTPAGRRIAYEKLSGNGPGVVFLGGLNSDMEGSKALHLHQWAQTNGRAFLRLDYSGHGQSDGQFTDGSIGDWAQDAEQAIDALTTGPQIVVGSSMGGWIALILAGRFGARIAGLVGIATAADFTEDGFWGQFTAQQRQQLLEKGQISMPSDFDEPYIITRRLIEDGREHLVLRAPLSLPMPVRFLQGQADTVVTPETALRLLDHAQGPDIRLTLVKDTDHRFSTPDCFEIIEHTVGELIDRAGQAKD